MDFRENFFKNRRSNSCSVRGCPNYKSMPHKKREMSFFRFPLNEFYYEDWVKACGYPNLKNVSKPYVCSDHFTKEDYASNVFDIEEGPERDRRKNRLKPTAVPSLKLPNMKVLKLKADSENLKLKHYERLLERDLPVLEPLEVVESSSSNEEMEVNYDDNLDEISLVKVDEEIECNVVDLDDPINSLNLCRVCSKDDEDDNKLVSIKDCEAQHVKILKKCFSISVPIFESYNWKICTNCNAFLQSLSKFSVHVEKVQQMLEVMKDLMVQDINFEVDEVRKNHGIENVNMRWYLIEDLIEKTDSAMDNVGTVKIKVEESDTQNISDEKDLNLNENQLINLEVIKLEDNKSDSNDSKEDKEFLDINDEFLNDNDDILEMENNVENYYSENERFDNDDDFIGFINTFDEIEENDDEIEENDDEPEEDSEQPKEKKKKSNKPTKKRARYTYQKPLECDICFKKVYGAKKLFDHKSDVHNIKPPEKVLDQEEARKNVKYCGICDRTFFHEYQLTQHYDLCHNIKRELICDYCGEKFNTTIKLNVHLRKHLPKEELLKTTEYQCQYCDKKVLTKESLTTHIKGYHIIQKDYVCEQCGKAFTCAKYLCLHRQAAHDNKEATCPMCKKVFKNKAKLRSHHYTVHGNMGKSNGNDIKKDPITCPICNKNFATKSSFRIHKLGHEFGRPFTCSYCKKSYKGIEALAMHIVKHTNLRPFNCSVCQKSFTAAAHAKKHITVVHGVKIRGTPQNEHYLDSFTTLDDLKEMLVYDNENDSFNIREDLISADGLIIKQVAPITEEMKINADYMSVDESSVEENLIKRIFGDF